MCLLETSENHSNGLSDYIQGHCMLLLGGSFLWSENSHPSLWMYWGTFCPSPSSSAQCWVIFGLNLKILVLSICSVMHTTATLTWVSQHWYGLLISICVSVGHIKCFLLPSPLPCEELLTRSVDLPSSCGGKRQHMSPPSPEQKPPGNWYVGKRKISCVFTFWELN